MSAAESAPQRRPEDAPVPSTAAEPRLPDPWSRRGALPLDGVLERGGGIWPWLMALLVLVGTFLVFNIVGGVLGGVMLGMRGDVGIEPGMSFAEVQQLIPPDVTVISNSVGQALGLGLPIFGLAWLHSSRVGGFLRLRRPPWAAVALALVGMAGLLPIVGVLTEINQGVPLPETFQQLEEMRMGMIYQILESGLGIGVVVVALAVVPALCEELAFRGYAQRQFERSTGPAGGIALTGVLFGVYHLSPAQVLPLTALGLYLAYLTWRTGSLWPAITVHFANNAFSIVSAQIAATRSDVSLAEMEPTGWAWYTVAGGLILFAAVLFLLHTRAPRWRPEARG